ncbi:precorrin-3B synthase [Pseudomonas sp. RIT-To-2]|uniref:precorrin-3B synthase n=1 Tax=Pseudomonas sp. RIT-To-2 TaxID=3462541 RepID=UPI00241378A5
MSPTQPPVSIRPSACPGLLRIVQALDGGICRIKLAGGELTAPQARAVADAAERFAGGVVEATNRANLQIRGITGSHPAMLEGLLAAGLGPRNSGGDDVRNLMLSPSAGIDPRMRFDTRPLAARILHSLESRGRLHELSAKFAVLLDGGEALAMHEHAHDLWLAPVTVQGRMGLGFGLAGCPGTALAAVAPEQGHALVIAVLERFLDVARPEQTRMRHVLEGMSPQDFIAPLSLDLWPGPFPVQAAGSDCLGTYPQRQAEQVFVGAAPPLGRLDPGMLRGLARLAEHYGDGTLRLTPWQSVLLPFVDAGDAAALTLELSALGLLCSSTEPLAGLIACTGSAGCKKGLADTKADARVLATLLPAPQAVHLCGCPRSCAAAHVAPATLLATSAGHYDLYLRDAGQPGFGALRARNLDLQAASDLLARLPTEQHR